jgi:NADH dehydrogenase
MPANPSNAATATPPYHVVIVGGGFGGLYAAKAFKNVPVKVTLIDKRNFHLFQPLLYQVATGGLSAGDISSPIRAILSRQKNVQVLMGEVNNLDPERKRVFLKDGQEVSYDSLILSTGVSHHYFGNDHWSDIAPGMKTIEDALEVRRRIFLAFEAAEKETDPDIRKALLTFVVVGGGPTGVELAGALAEIAYGTLKGDFNRVNTTDAEVILLEGMDRVLPPYPPELSAEAEASLRSLGVTVQTNTLVTNIDGDVVTLKRGGDRTETMRSCTVLWAAGVKASPMGKVLSERTGAELDRAGRVIVEPDLSLPNYPSIHVIGDLAHYAHQGDRPLPGVAPVAMQQGQYIAKLIARRLKGDDLPPFQYNDMGSLAVIGRNAAVVNLKGLRFTGFPAWLIWIFVHIYYLIEFDNKLLVMLQWGWNYLTKKRGARLITGHDELPSAPPREQVAPFAADPVEARG